MLFDYCSPNHIFPLSPWPLCFFIVGICIALKFLGMLMLSYRRSDHTLKMVYFILYTLYLNRVDSKRN